MVDLFGGAIVITIPSQWRDVSQVRQVPDNQEVYQDCTEESGGVIVVEILQYQDDAQDGTFFFNDLGEANGIITTTTNEQQEQSIIHSSRVVNLLGHACEEGNKEQIFPELTLPPCTTLQSQVCACLVNGSQQVVKEKSRNASENDNNNDDNAAAAQWIDIEMCALRLKDIETDILITLSVPRKEDGGRANNSPVSGTTAEGRGDMFKQILASFNIRDYSLFG